MPRRWPGQICILNGSSSATVCVAKRHVALSHSLHDIHRENFEDSYSAQRAIDSVAVLRTVFWKYRNLCDRFCIDGT